MSLLSIHISFDVEQNYRCLYRFYHITPEIIKYIIKNIAAYTIKVNKGNNIVKYQALKGCVSDKLYHLIIGSTIIIYANNIILINPNLSFAF